MGLDMFMFSLPKVTGRKFEDIVQASLALEKEGREALPEDILRGFEPFIRKRYLFGEPDRAYETVLEEVGYWRKANHIHRWFVEHIQDGKDDQGSYEVTREDLLSLRRLCEKVLKNPKRARELLPTTSGFFFGSTEYGESYFEDLKDTISIIDAALSVLELGNKHVFYNSWW